MSLAPVNSFIIGSSNRSSFMIYDWDSDGLLDVLKLERKLMLYKNIGTKTEYKFAKTGDTIPLIDCPNPKEAFIPALSGDYITTGDFNADGLQDLVLKTAVSGVTFDPYNKNNVTSIVDIYINTGTKNAPEFTYADRLLNSTDGSYGGHATVAAGDLNSDGATDIIMSAMTLDPTLGWNLYTDRWELFVWWGIPNATPVVKNKISKKCNVERFEYDANQGIIKNASLVAGTKISLYSITGRAISIKSDGKGVWKIPRELSTGIYIVKIDNIIDWRQKIVVK